MERSGDISSKFTDTGEEVSSRSVVRETGVSLSYPMLNKHNYNTWAIRMKVCMKAQGVWDAVVSEDPDDKKDQMALTAIFQGVPDETLLLLSEKETAKQVWDTLKTTLVGADRVKEARAQTLKSEFERLLMKDADNIDDFAARLTSIVNQIRGLVKRILRYIRGSLSYGCFYKRKGEKEPELVGYSDSDLAGDIDDRKSTTGIVFYLGENPITWLSHKQKIVALSSCEAEHIAAACQGVWLARLLADLTMEEPQKFKLLVDNKSTISLCKNPVHQDRSKHIDKRYHYIRECIDSGKMKVKHIRTQDQVADVLTKDLGWTEFDELKGKLGMKKMDQLD